MEVLSPFEGLDEGERISPRLSFSQDFQFSGRCSPKMQFKDTTEEEFSFIFRQSVSLDLSSDDSMLSADELFFDGKVRPLRENAGCHAVGGYMNEQNMGFERSSEENPRCRSMTINSCRGEGQGGRAYMSLNSSRCSSPSRTMSMPRTTPTSPKHAMFVPSSSVSSMSDAKSSLAASSECKVSASLLASSQDAPSSSSSSRRVSSSNPALPSKYSSKLKEFFKLKKGNLIRDTSSPSCPSVSSSAEISRESVQASGSTSCRLPSRSFWPFSRSNSAGESKITPSVSPPPRRSNSAGEGKTMSSSLLPMNGSPTGQITQEDAPLVANLNVQGKVGPPPTEATSSSNALSKKGLPPLPNSNSKKSMFLVSVRCGTDRVAVASQPAPVLAGNSSNRVSGPTSSSISNEADSLSCQSIPPACANERLVYTDERKPGNDLKLAPDARSVSAVRKGSSNTAASPGRPVRRGVHSSASRNFARASPGRRGAWNSPGRGNGGRISIRNLDRSNLSSKGNLRPRDMLSRDGVSGRISPVLNVAVPSLRGSKASSKSKMFRLGNLFSKKDMVVTSRANVLPPTDSPNQE